MSNITKYEEIQNAIYSKANVQYLNAVLGERRGKQYALSVLSFIKRTQGDKDPRKDLTISDPHSVVNAVRDAAKLRMEIDGRGHAHLVKYGNSVSLQIGYRGYLSRLQSSLPGFTAHVECVYKGDTVEVVQDGLCGSVKHIRTNPFATKTDADIEGAYAQISYLVGDRRVTYVTTMSRSEIEKVKRSAKTQDIWNAWFSEKAKVAVLRRACKMHFSAVTHDLDVADDAGYAMEHEQKTAAANEATSTLIDAVHGSTDDSEQMKDVTNA